MAVEGNGGACSLPEASKAVGSNKIAKPNSRQLDSLELGSESGKIYDDWLNPGGPIIYTNLDRRLMVPGD